MSSRCFGVIPPKAMCGGHGCNHTSTVLQIVAPHPGLLQGAYRSPPTPLTGKHPYGKRAASVRNAKMLRDGHPNMVIAFEGGTATANMVLG